MRVAATFILLTQSALLSAPSSAQTSAASTYSEMSREQTLPLIARALRDFLVDSGSVTNFSVCYPALKVKMRDGRPLRWTIMFSLNARNRLGGYTGAEQMAAVFRPDRPVEIISTGMPPGLGDYGTCTRVPDAEIHRMIETE